MENLVENVIRKIMKACKYFQRINHNRWPYEVFQLGSLQRRRKGCSVKQRMDETWMIQVGEDQRKINWENRLTWHSESEKWPD